MLSLEDVTEAIAALKKINMATGPDAIQAEILKYGGVQLHTNVHHLISEIWSSELVPQVCKDENLIAIFKNKDDEADCGNSMGVALLSVLAKIILHTFVHSITESLLPEAHCGFRAERFAVDMVSSARQVLAKCREEHRELHIAFIDLS